MISLPGVGFKEEVSLGPGNGPEDRAENEYPEEFVGPSGPIFRQKNDEESSSPPKVHFPHHLSPPNGYPCAILV